MDPKVCGKLLTTHRKGYGVDVEALRGRFPLRRSADEGSKMGSCGYRRLRRWTLFFVGSLDVFGERGYIKEEEVGWWPPRLLLGLHSKSSGSRSFQKSRSRRFHSVWTPISIPFLRNSKTGKKTETGTRPTVNRLVPKII